MPKEGLLKLYLNSKKNKGSHQMFERKGRGFVNVECESWASIPKECNKAKIDIEGSEYLLVEKCLSEIKNIEVAIIEMHINGFGLERYNKAVKTLEQNYPNGNYDKEPKKKWHTYAILKK